MYNTLLVGCLSVCIVKTDEPNGLKCCMGPHMIHGLRFTDAQNYKNLCLKVFDFLNLENAQKK